MRALAWLDVTDAALVLGSTQPDVSAPDLAVVRRRSGGGAVLLEPDSVLWADVFVPRRDPVWDDDVGRAFWWLGDTWAAALTDVGLPAPAVHRGPLVRTPLAELVCFAGLGAGEVVSGGRKVVGMAQRRTREGALFQCAVPLAWDPTRLAEVMGVSADLAELADAVRAVEDVDPDELRAAFERHLP